jgi:hypothetical protein
MKKAPVKKVKIKPLKEFALHHLPASSHLRELILSEKDVLPAEEFIACVSVWLRLLDLELNDRKTRQNIF